MFISYKNECFSIFFFCFQMLVACLAIVNVNAGVYQTAVAPPAYAKYVPYAGYPYTSETSLYTRGYHIAPYAATPVAHVAGPVAQVASLLRTPITAAYAAHQPAHYNAVEEYPSAYSGAYFKQVAVTSPYAAAYSPAAAYAPAAHHIVKASPYAYKAPQIAVASPYAAAYTATAPVYKTAYAATPVYSYGAHAQQYYKQPLSTSIIKAAPIGYAQSYAYPSIHQY